MSAQSVSRVGAWRWGLLLGAIDGVLSNGAGLLFGYLFPGANELVSNLGGIALFGLSLAICGYAGYLAARKSGNPYMGNSVGLYVGLIYAIITGFFSILMLSNSGLAVRSFPLVFILSVACVAGVYGLLALVAGIIGGKLAQRRLGQSA
jgi:hypothetical protein